MLAGSYRFIIILFFLFAYQVSTADEFLSTKQDVFNLSLAELSLLEVDVATRTPVELIDVPANVSIYTRQEIQAMGIETLEQLLNFVVGVQTSRSDQGGLAQGPSFRGRRATSSTQDVLVLYDGIRLNDVVAGGSFSQEPEIVLDNIKQVEIIRGPGSALYGANAFSGVISLIPETKKKEFEVSYGSFEQKEISLQTTFDHPFLSLSIFARHYEDDGDSYDDFYNFFGVRDDTQDPKRQQDLYISADIKGLVLKLRHSERKYFDFINGGAMADGDQHMALENDNLRLEYRWNQPFSDWLFYIEHSQSNWDQLIGLFPENALIDPANTLYWSNESTQLMLGGNVRDLEQSRAGIDLNWSISPRHELALGVVARQESNSLNPFQTNIDAMHLKEMGERIPLSGNRINTGFYINGERFDLLESEERDIWGVYLQDRWQVLDDLSLTLGMRHDDYDDFGDNSSFRGGMVYQPESSQRIKLMYGEAYRAPSFGETRQGIASGGIANEDLKPERVKTTELVWEYISDSIFVNSTLFMNKYTDIVEFVSVSDVVPGFTALQPQNKGSQTSEGLEVEAILAINQEWELRASGMHLLKRLKDQPIAGDTLALMVNWHQDQLNFNLNGFYRQKISFMSQTDQKYELDDYWLLNTKVSYRLTSKWQADFKVENLLNEAYTTWSPQAGLEGGLPARQRSYVFGIKYFY